MASDMWHGTGAKIDGILLQTGIYRDRYPWIGSCPFSYWFFCTGFGENSYVYSRSIISDLVPDGGGKALQIKTGKRLEYLL